MNKTLERFDQLTRVTGVARVDLIAEIRLLHTNLFLAIIIGEDIGMMEVEFFKYGVRKQVPIGYALIQLFEDLLMRMISLHVVFFPCLANKPWFTPYERECNRNATTIRNLIRSLLRERKSSMSSGKWTSQADLLSIMLSNDYFADNEDSIIDELLTIFFAGSQTSSKAS